ncbi:MAG TPA: hypothetical protein VM489_08865, partial [Burkholderiales bacterium]|nr:hypothetical protein [Burkholderiales bacterium]
MPVASAIAECGGAIPASSNDRDEPGTRGEARSQEGEQHEQERGLHEHRRVRHKAHRLDAGEDNARESGENQ